MFSPLAALKGWMFDLAMLLLTVAGVLTTHTLFKLGERLTRAWRGSESRKT